MNTIDSSAYLNGDSKCPQALNDINLENFVTFCQQSQEECPQIIHNVQEILRLTSKTLMQSLTEDRTIDQKQHQVQASKSFDMTKGNVC